MGALARILRLVLRISCVFEVVLAFVLSEGVEQGADRHPEVFDGSFGGLSEQGLELGEGELYGVEVR